MSNDIGVIRNDESEGLRFGKLMAECYYYMAKNIVEAMGEEEGEKVIRKALKEFGEDRVSSIKAEALEKGVTVDSFEKFFTVRDMPDCGWVNGDERGVVEQCLFHEVWKRYGDMGMKMGALYCEIDYILYGSFGFELDRPECKCTGGDRCIFHFTYK